KVHLQVTPDEVPSILQRMNSRANYRAGPPLEPEEVPRTPDGSLLDNVAQMYHPETMSYTYRCRSCRVERKNMNSVKIHFMVVHEGARRYMCTRCGEKKYFKVEVINHYLKDHENRSYQEIPRTSRKRRLEIGAQYVRPIHRVEP